VQVLVELQVHVHGSARDMSILTVLPVFVRILTACACLILLKSTSSTDSMISLDRNAVHAGPLG